MILTSQEDISQEQKSDAKLQATISGPSYTDKLGLKSLNGNGIIELIAFKGNMGCGSHQTCIFSWLNDTTIAIAYSMQELPK